MTENHPITPSTELVKQWLGTYFSTTITGEVSDVELTLATQAARWGADQELAACCSQLAYWGAHGYKLHDARRPKPPSLKELNLKHLEVMERDGHYLPEIVADLRRAIESLPS